jgi:hypothetical protein
VNASPKRLKVTLAVNSSQRIEIRVLGLGSCVVKARLAQSGGLRLETLEGPGLHSLFATMWCPIRMGTWCMGLKQESPLKWKCEICSRITNAMENANRTLPDFPEVDREHASVAIPEPHAPAHSLYDLFEAHYQSKTHIICVYLLLLGAFRHGNDFKNMVADWLDPFIENFTTRDDRHTISRFMYLYIRSGDSRKESGKCLGNALMLSHESMRRQIRSSLALGCCKQLAVSLARAELFDSPTTFVKEEDIRSFLLKRQDAWKQHKAVVLAGGQVSLIVSLVLPFLPEFVDARFDLLFDARRDSKRRRVEGNDSDSVQRGA